MSDVPTRLKDLLVPAGKTLGVEAPEVSARLFSGWEAVVGADVARHSRPARLKNGVLRVWVDSPAWATEMTYLGPQIVYRLAETIGTDAIAEIRPYLGTPPRQAPSPQAGDARPFLPARPAGDPDDPVGALQRARRAWERRRSKGRRTDSPEAHSDHRSNHQIPR